MNHAQSDYQSEEFSAAFTEHVAKSEACSACYAPPKPCKCGGLIHYDYVGEGDDYVSVANVCDNDDCDEDVSDNG